MEGVREAVVLLREDVPDEKRLVAYVVPADENAIDAGHLLERLKKRLPLYMIPAACVVLESLPLTASSKVDRQALPVPENFAQSTARTYVAPRTPVEEMLAKIWAEVLGVERVGVHDDFFQLGGHSLLATQIISQMREALQAEVPLSALFASPTVGGLALTLAQSQVEAGSDGDLEQMLTELEKLSEGDVKMLLDTEMESTQEEKS
jgi:acyl carrier protein